MNKVYLLCFFFSSRRRHTRLTCDWSSDVCSSDLDRDRRLDLLLVVERHAGAAPTEDRREQVAQPTERAQIGHIEVGIGAWCRPATAPVPLTGARERSIAPQLIVLLSLLRVAQDVVRLVDLLEAVGGLRIVGIAIGMVLLREAAKRLLDLVGGRRLGHAEDLVIVSL